MVNSTAIIASLNRVVIAALAVVSVLACKVTDNHNTPPPAVTPVQSEASSTSLDTAVNNPTQRLARAAEVRHYLRDNDIPANVVAIDRTLKVHYQRASADYMDGIFETFCRQQNIEGLLGSGFDTLLINADDSFGKNHEKSFPLADCKKVQSIDWPSPKKKRSSMSLLAGCFS